MCCATAVGRTSPTGELTAMAGACGRAAAMAARYGPGRPCRLCQVLHQSSGGQDSGGAVHTFVGDFLQPACHLNIGCNNIQLEPGLLQPARQQHVERTAQVAVKALNLTFGLGAVCPAQLDDKAAVFGVVEKPIASSNEEPYLPRFSASLAGSNVTFMNY